MSKLLVVAVRDSAISAFNRPFFVPAKGAAIRSFMDEVNRQAADNMLFTHPEHFALYELGEYDDMSGEFTTHLPELIVAADSVKGTDNAS